VGDYAARPTGFTGGLVSVGLSPDRSEEIDITGIRNCYPNPFGGTTSIEVQILKADAAKVKLIRLYNYLGELIDVIDISQYGEGLHLLELNFTEKYAYLPSGLYQVHLVVGDEISSRSSLVYYKL